MSIVTVVVLSAILLTVAGCATAIPPPAAGWTISFSQCSTAPSTARYSCCLG